MFIETQFFTIKISQQRKLISRMLGEHHYSFFFSFFSFFFPSSRTREHFDPKLASALVTQARGTRFRESRIFGIGSGLFVLRACNFARVIRRIIESDS